MRQALEGARYGCISKSITMESIFKEDGTANGVWSCKGMFLFVVTRRGRFGVDDEADGQPIMSCAGRDRPMSPVRLLWHVVETCTSSKPHRNPPGSDIEVSFLHPPSCSPAGGTKRKECLLAE